MDRDALLGKHLLIGITFLDDHGNVIEQFQTHGPIVLIDDERGIVIERADGSGTYGIPPDLRNLRSAPPGEYRLRSTGEIVRDPDFTSNWTVEKTRPDTIERYKRSGFTGFGPPN